MKVGDLVKMKSPSSQYGWRLGAEEGIGVVIKAAHRTSRTMHGCTILWTVTQQTQEMPQDWLEIISENKA